MSENDVKPKVPQAEQEVKPFINGRVRMDTQVGNTQEASSLNNEPRVDHPSNISSKVDALSLSETNEYTEFMHKLSAIESRRTGNDALDRNRVRRPREKLFQEFFRTHKNLHSHLAIRIAAENKSFRDALLTKRVEQVIENNPFLIDPNASQTKDGWTIDKALIKIQEFELLLREIQQLENPEIPLLEIKLSKHSLKKVRDMRYNLREKLRVVDPEGVRQWIMVTADAEAPARIEAARNKKQELVTHQTAAAQNEEAQQTVPKVENMDSSTQEVRNLMHTSEQEYKEGTDIRHQLAQASRSNLSARLKEGPADPLQPLEDPVLKQQTNAQDLMRESLQKLSASNLTQRLEQGPQQPIDDTSQPYPDALSQSAVREVSHSTQSVDHPIDQAREREKERIDRKVAAANIATVVSAMLQSDNPRQVAEDARGNKNNGIAGFAANTVLNTEAQAIETAQRDAKTSSTTEQPGQTSKSGGFLRRFLGGLRR